MPLTRLKHDANDRSAAEQTSHPELGSRNLWPLELAQQTPRPYFCSPFPNCFFFFCYAYRYFEGTELRLACLYSIHDLRSKRYVLCEWLSVKKIVRNRTFNSN
jgi:hypothetical protein